MKRQNFVGRKDLEDLEKYLGDYDSEIEDSEDEK